MKARLLIAFALAIGLALILAWVVAAQGTGAKIHAQSTPYVVSATGHHPIRQNIVGLGYTEDITFTPAFTVYLPLVQRTIIPPCTTAPTLISPTNGSLLNTLAPTLIYMRGTAPVSYTSISVADNPAFSTLVDLYGTAGGGLGPMQLRLWKNLQPATVYYWRVQDVCGSVHSPYSSVFSFTTGSGGVILPAPVLVSPVSGTLGIGQEVTLTWNSVAGALGYQVWIYAVGSGGRLYFTSGTSQVVRRLQASATYEWYVDAYNDYAYGDMSDKWLFGTGSFLLSGSHPEEMYTLHYPGERPWRPTPLPPVFKADLND